MKILTTLVILCISLHEILAKTPRRDIPSPFEHEYRRISFSTNNYHRPTEPNRYISNNPIPKPKTINAKNAEPINILREFRDEPVNGKYQFGFETQNGIRAEESGLLGNKNPKDDNQNAEGYFSYSNADGSVITLTYTADENGFVAKGDHLPTPPPIPPAILKALEWNAAHPEEWNWINEENTVNIGGQGRNNYNDNYNNKNKYGRRY